MNLDSGSLPARCDGVRIIDEQIRTRSDVFTEVRHDAEMDLDVIAYREPVPAAVVLPSREPEPCRVRQRNIEIAHGKDRCDPHQSAHGLTLRRPGSRVRALRGRRTTSEPLGSCL